jgi:NAD(P)H-nitrite reductase large subunit
MKHVIIGNGPAGISAAQAIRNADKNAKITIVSDEEIECYGRPLISYYLSGKIDEQNIFYKPKNFYKKEKIELLLNVRAEKIDAKSKKISLSNGSQIEYDKALIATGSSPFIPPIENLKNQKNVFTFLTFSQSKLIKDAINKDSKVIIAGAGLIGLKAAEGLYGQVSKITVIDLADRAMSSVLDKTAAGMIERHIAKKGIEIVLKNSIKAVKGEQEVESIVLSNGRELECSVLIMAVGTRPNVLLAKDAGLNMDRAIIVDENMRSSNEDIYAAGDCVQTHDLLSGEKKIFALFPTAVSQGEIAGMNMAGGKEKYQPSFAMNAISFFGMQLISAGITGGKEGDVFYDEENETLRRLNISNDNLIGFVLINDAQRAGIYTSLINDKTKLSELQYDIRSKDIDFSVYSKEMRANKIWGK